MNWLLSRRQSYVQPQGDQQVPPYSQLQQLKKPRAISVKVNVFMGAIAFLLAAIISSCGPTSSGATPTVTQTQVNTTATAQAQATATFQAQANATATAQAQTATATATPRVTITFPTEGSKVGMVITVRGTASNIPQGEKLWVLVKVEGIIGYYPQNGPIDVLSDGTWSADTAIGGPNDAGRKFELLTALADQEGEATLEQYINSGKTSGSFPNIPLPKGVQVISQVQVVRQ